MTLKLNHVTQADWLTWLQTFRTGLPADDPVISGGPGIPADPRGITRIADHFTTQPHALARSTAEAIGAMLQSLEGFDFDRGLALDAKALLQQLNQSDGRMLKALLDPDGEVDRELEPWLEMFDANGDGKIGVEDLELLLYRLTQGRGVDGNATLDDAPAAGTPVPNGPGNNLGSLSRPSATAPQVTPSSWGNLTSPASSDKAESGQKPGSFTRKQGATPTTVPEANSDHITQFINADFNPDGPSSSSNCGPASLAMALSALGVMPKNLTQEQKVDFARALMYGSKYTPGGEVPLVDADGEPTNVDQIVAGAKNAGIPATHTTGFEDLDQALAEGKTIVAYGDITEGWRKQFDGVQANTSEVRYGSGSGGHFIAILGQTADGKYIVSDPMFTGGSVAMTADQLAAFRDPPGFAAIG